MAPLPIIEHLDILEDVLCRLAPRRVLPMVHELALQVPKKLSTQALSQQLPVRLMLAVMPCVVSSCWYCPAAYWADSTGRRNTGLSGEL